MSHTQESIHVSGRPARAVPLPAAGTLRSKRYAVLRRALAAVDSLAIGGALLVGIGLVGEGHPARIVVGLATLPAWIVLCKLYGLYDRDGKRVSHSTVEDLPWAFHAFLVGTLGLTLLFKLLPSADLSISQGMTVFGLSLVGLLVGRSAVRRLVLTFVAPERVLFVGGGPLVDLLVEKVRRHPEYGLEPVGYLRGDWEENGAPTGELPALGLVADLHAVCAQQAVEHLIVVMPPAEEHLLEGLIRQAKDMNVRMCVVPHVVDVLGPAVEIDHLEGVTVLGLSPPTLSRSSLLLKRMLDVVVASTVLALALPVMAVIAALVKLTSRGPVFYAQERIGRGGRRFRLHKFRTMVPNADQRADELRGLSAHPVWLLLEDDPRITSIGRFLRRTSLDELPQLWNVLIGNMSLVGPRPMPPAVDEQIFGWGRRRLDLTPGITGLWQVLGRTSIPFEEMLKLDSLYVTNWSLWQDVRLLIQTLPAVVRRRGAN